MSETSSTSSSDQPSMSVALPKPAAGAKAVFKSPLTWGAAALAAGATAVSTATIGAPRYQPVNVYIFGNGNTVMLLDSAMVPPGSDLILPAGLAAGNMVKEPHERISSIRDDVVPAPDDGGTVGRPGLRP